eukprot:Skav218895  [mRNA]  locus=scaffold328:233531:248780:+ [translate_table: standard]
MALHFSCDVDAIRVFKWQLRLSILIQLPTFQVSHEIESSQGGYAVRPLGTGDPGKAQECWKETVQLRSGNLTVGNLTVAQTAWVQSAFRCVRLKRATFEPMRSSSVFAEDESCARTSVLGRHSLHRKSSNLQDLIDLKDSEGFSKDEKDAESQRARRSQVSPIQAAATAGRAAAGYAACLVEPEIPRWAAEGLRQRGLHLWSSMTTSEIANLHIFGDHFRPIGAHPISIFAQERERERERERLEQEKEKEREREQEKEKLKLEIPLSPAKELTEFEQGEILDFPQIWYFGAGAQKIRGTSAATNNHSYDDERGDYMVVLHDHILYRYEVLNPLGKGSFGQVVRSFDFKTNNYAQPQLFELDRGSGGSEDPGASQRTGSGEHLKRVAATNHLCITFELLSINLYEFIKNNNFQGVSLGLIRRFAIQLLAALRFLRKLHIIHCDLKPVIDFGSSCFEDERVYTYIQSRFYRSPEVEQLACIMEIFGATWQRIKSSGSTGSLDGPW